MSHKHPPNPARFDLYKDLPDGSGFTIKDCEFVFKFDKRGGWFDQYGNYYNRDGKPTEAPSDSEQYHSEDQHSHDYDEDDQFQKQFGGPGKNFSDQEDDTEDIHLVKIATNLQILNSYPAGKPFRVNFRNLNFFSNRSQVFQHFKSKVPGILNVIFFQNDKKQFNGTGYFVLEDGKSGQSLIKLEGEIFKDRDLSFSLDSAQEFILYPIQNHELYPDFSQKKAVKNYITKGKPLQEEQTKETKKQQFPQMVKVQAKVEQKLQQKQQSPVKITQQAETKEEQQFCSYIFQRKPFPKKSSFNQWIQSNHFSHQSDVKEVSKIIGDQTRAKVCMKRKIFNLLNGKQLNGVTVTFQPTLK